MGALETGYALQMAIFNRESDGQPMSPLIIKHGNGQLPVVRRFSIKNSISSGFGIATLY